MASSTKNVKLGVCKVSYNGNDLGYTQGGVDVTVKTDTHKVNVDQFGKTTINEIIMGRDVMVKVPLAETTIDNMVTIMPGSIVVTSGLGAAAATGTIVFGSVASAGDTVTVNGTVFTFRATPSVQNEIALGTTPATSATNLYTALNNTLTGSVTNATYANATPGTVSVTYAYLGATGNSFTLAKTGSSCTVSGTNLTGGADGPSKSISVPTAVGTNLLDIAKSLRLHPTNKADGDVSEDFVVPLAATAGALQFAYKLENERIFNVEFNGYPDSANGGKLFTVGV